jgi:hypothetical protein
MARHFPNSPAENPRQLFSETVDPSVLSGHFWAKLIQYRPLLLLGVFWLTLICVAAVAYSRLMFSGVPVNSSSTAPTMIQRSTPPPVIRPAARGTIDAEPFSGSGPTTDLEVSPGDLSDATGQGGGFFWKRIWELMSLVGLCALGSLIIAYQAKRPARAKKRRKVSPKASVKRKPAAKKVLPQPKRLSPYSPDRDRVVVPGAMVPPEQPFMAGSSSSQSPSGQATATPISPAPPGTFPPSQPPVQPSAQSANLPPAPPQQREADIVPEHEDHPLDWSEASIAHTLDLRQRRSLSSFM